MADVPDDVEVVSSNCLHCVLSVIVQKYQQATGAEVDKLVSALLQVVAEIVESDPNEPRRAQTKTVIPGALAHHYGEARKGFDEGVNVVAPEDLARSGRTH